MSVEIRSPFFGTIDGNLAVQESQYLEAIDFRDRFSNDMDVLLTKFKPLVMHVTYTTAAGKSWHDW